MISDHQSDPEWQRFLIRYYSIFQQTVDDQEKKFFVIELGQTDLEKVITCFAPLPIGVIQHILAQCIQALEQLHSLKYAHRDVKPSNFLIDRNGNIKLADFGTAKQFDPQELDCITGKCSYNELRQQRN